MSLLTLLLVLIVLSIFFGGYGTTREGWGYMGWSPLGFIVLLALVLYVGGYLH